jgi:hypothetical protein
VTLSPGTACCPVGVEHFPCRLNDGDYTIVRIHPNSFAFTLLGLLSSLPTFGIDMILPTLSATGANLDAPPSSDGLAMSVYLLAWARPSCSTDRYPIAMAVSRSCCSVAGL